MILPDPRELGPLARTYARVCVVLVACYVGMIAAICALYTYVPHPLLGLPAGIAMLCGARCSQYLMAYHRHRQSLNG